MRAPLDVDRITSHLAGSEITAVRVLAEVDSTNAEVGRTRRLGEVVFADFQSGGRGRLGRSWQEVPRAGLAMSVLLPTPGGSAGWMPLITGMALHAAIRDVTGIDAAVKWPNDLLDPTGQRKLSGILCELLPEGVVVGAGVNVDHTAAELPVETATSLALVGGASYDRSELAGTYLGNLAELHGRLAEGGEAAREVREEYRRICATIGAIVDLHAHDGRVTRVEVTGVDDDGRLVVLGPAGRATVSAGDVHHVRRAG